MAADSEAPSEISLAPDADWSDHPFVQASAEDIKRVVVGVYWHHDREAVEAGLGYWAKIHFREELGREPVKAPWLTKRRIRNCINPDGAAIEAARYALRDIAVAAPNTKSAHVQVYTMDSTSSRILAHPDKPTRTSAGAVLYRHNLEKVRDEFGNLIAIGHTQEQLQNPPRTLQALQDQVKLLKFWMYGGTAPGPTLWVNLHDVGELLKPWRNERKKPGFQAALAYHLVERTEYSERRIAASMGLRPAQLKRSVATMKRWLDENRTATEK